MPLERSQKTIYKTIKRFLVFRILFRVFNAKKCGNDQINATAVISTHFANFNHL
jgi:hypothetical protein